MPRQLTAFARFCPLGDLDLYLVSVGEVMAGNTETAGRHLLDGASGKGTVGPGDKPYRVFPSLARIAPASEVVHGSCNGFMNVFA